MSGTRRVWKLARRPVGEIADGDLVLVEEPLPEPGPGQVLVRVGYLSLDPTNRIWMSDMEQYMPPVELGEPMRGGIVGRVVKSRNSAFAEGQLVAGLGAWTDYLLSDGTGLQPMPEIPGIPVPVAFGTFGVVGPTAYFGLLDIGQPQPGETLVVSAAAGGVGQIVGQLGKIHGCRVIGIAGGPQKCRFITEELGFDAAIDHRTEDVGAALDRLAPDGIDINFEQVGGPIMREVTRRLRRFGRMPLCGLISRYNAKDPMVEEPGFWTLILMRRLTIRGFIVTDFAPRFPEAVQRLAQWMLEGRLKVRQDIRPGLEHAADYVKLLYTGGNFGKLMVEVNAL
ncbi:MAG: NADP-dependent oxidoreductase [Sphingomonadaceae bacterium]|uniref:NADP-dependent oxidoreductase n=1 Tax=Thermaurantiacus sp. TaxID=2820283 RepID=UPI00298F1394|nr:NADP-dependent oxidoreductase [Thermaurantiacus sp.]MCS6986996.1 NADP-dependent oxidoreductase [Sphingomonadaceae bacterium]MDW8415666.1 NADP-dependent oxidoreductase [Thermaurantiacus sp.]